MSSEKRNHLQLGKPITVRLDANGVPQVDTPYTQYAAFCPTCGTLCGAMVVFKTNDELAQRTVDNWRERGLEVREATDDEIRDAPLECNCGGVKD